MYAGINAPQQVYLQQVMKVTELIGYMMTQKDSITIMVPKSQELLPYQNSFSHVVV